LLLGRRLERLSNRTFALRPDLAPAIFITHTALATFAAFEPLEPFAGAIILRRLLRAARLDQAPRRLRIQGLGLLLVRQWLLLLMLTPLLLFQLLTLLFLLALSLLLQ
jgi:hypothetical protein